MLPPLADQHRPQHLLRTLDGGRLLSCDPSVPQLSPHRTNGASCRHPTRVQLSLDSSLQSHFDSTLLGSVAKEPSLAPSTCIAAQRRAGADGRSTLSSRHAFSPLAFNASQQRYVLQQQRFQELVVSPGKFSREWSDGQELRRERERRTIRSLGQRAPQRELVAIAHSSWTR